MHSDYLGPFVKNKRGHLHILVISDAFTNFQVVQPVRTTMTQYVLQVLNYFIGYFGLPKRIITEGGTAFTNDTLHIKTPVRAPQTAKSSAKEWDNQLRN